MRGLILISVSLFLHLSLTEETSVDQKQFFKKSEQKLSDQILKLLEHYKQDDPVGMPGAPVPDPLSIPDLAHSFSVGRMTFKKVKLYGLTKFRLTQVKADITAMKVEAALTIAQLAVLGNYTLSTLFTSARGPFTVQLVNVQVKAIATLQVERSGQLEAQDMNLDISVQSIDLKFKNLGFLASLFESILNGVGNFVFNSIKPFILREVNSNMIKDINQQIKKVPQKFPNSISPFDQLLVDVRHKIRAQKYDPYQVNDYNTSVGMFDVYMTHTWLYGISSIHREGDIIFDVKNNTLYASLEVGTQRMEGTSNWEVSLISGYMSKAGTVSFSVEYLKVQVLVSQTMDTTNSPRLEDIQLELGNIQMRFDGVGTLDYIIEFAVNVLPNLLRYQIMEALETPVKKKIQLELDKINVEEMIKDNLDKIDNPNEMQFF